MLATLAMMVLMSGMAPVASAAPVVSAASAGSKVVGFATYAWGSVSEPGEREVWTEVDVGGSWSRSQVGRTDAQGAYVIELTYGFTTVGVYRYRVGAATSAGVVYSEPFLLERTAWQPGWVGSKPVFETTNVWGTMPRAAGRSVWTEVLVGGQWSRSQVRTADGSGYFVIPLTYGAGTVGEYTFRVGASTSLGVVYSQAFVLRRTATVVAYSAGTKPVNEVTNTWGTVRGYGGGQVFTQVLLSSGWSTSQVRTSDASGYFVIPLTYGSSTPGTYTFRVGASTPFGTVYSTQFTLERTAVTRVDCAVRACVALTFDDGPSAYTDRLIDTLVATRTPATFFVVGSQVATRPATVRRMQSAGLAVENHTYSHPQLTTLSYSGQLSQVTRTDDALAAAGVRRSTQLRPPYGSWNSTTRTLGKPLILWSVDPRDWEVRDAARIRSYVAANTTAGAIVLMHDSHSTTVDAVPGIISDLRARGFTLVTVDTLVPSLQPGDVVYSRTNIRRAGTSATATDQGEVLRSPDGSVLGPVLDEAPFTPGS